jgi:predicted amidohydrolase
MDVTLGDPERNLARVVALTAEAARRDSAVVVFPELWSTGYDLENAGRHATHTDAGMFAAMADLARQHHLALVGSCLSLLGPEKYGNTAVYVSPDGEVTAAYSKMHLFRLMDEDQFLTAGDRPVLVETGGGPAGLAICYDLRFPELFRRYALDGAGLVFLPAEWPHPRRSHWRTLVRARAIENQLFMVACNRVGTSQETAFCGHSLIVDPWGETVIEGGEEEMLLTATIDTGRVATIRQKIPVFQDRRPGRYGPIG